jgi:hypothetical protein
MHSIYYFFRISEINRKIINCKKHLKLYRYLDVTIKAFNLNVWQK